MNKRFYIKKSSLFIVVVAFAVAVIFTGCNRPETLREAYQDDFYIGAAVTVGDFQSQPFYKMYDEEVLKNYSSFSTENAMKPEVVYSDRGPEHYRYKYAEDLLRYANEHDIVVRGHTLLWHQSVAKMVSVNMSKEEARANLEEFISNYVGHFKGRVYAWDVANEVISDSGEVYRERSPWYIAYGGPEYISDAFMFAHAADPDAELIYNDYSVVDSAKRARIKRMIVELKLKEKGLTGVGIQAHWNLTYPSIEMINETLDDFRRMGLTVHITELDIDCYGDPDLPEQEYTSKLEKKLADRYEEIFLCFRENNDVVSSVTTWGIGDDHTWLHKFCTRPIPYRTNYPLLFDYKGEAKKCFYSILYAK